MLFISPPVSNLVSFPNTISIIGTYTLYPRPGRLKNFITTLRSDLDGSWYNKIGLRNSGINSVGYSFNKVISVHGFSKHEWNWLLLKASDKCPLSIELNLSCPNVEKISFDNLLRTDYRLIAKLGPIDPLVEGKRLFDLGIRTFHLCNSLPSASGAISGKKLLSYSLAAVEEFRKYFGNKVELIAGGGISSVKIAKLYLKLGANHLALGSMLLNPMNWYKVREIRKLCNDPYSSWNPL